MAERRANINDLANNKRRVSVLMAVRPRDRSITPV